MRAWEAAVHPRPPLRLHALTLRLTSVGNHHALLIYSFVNGVTYLVAWLLIDARRPAAKRRWLPRKINGSFYCMTFSMFFSNWGYLVSGSCPVGRVWRCREGL